MAFPFSPTDLGPVNDPAYQNPSADAAGPTGIFPAVLKVQPFPVWPPPSGGYPVVAFERGPDLYTYPYGTLQGANIAIAGPAPAKNATAFPMRVTPYAGQVQATTMPAWPSPAKFNTKPDIANPIHSKLAT